MRLAALALAVVATSGPASAAAPCANMKPAARKAKPECGQPVRRFEPYDPDRMKGGGRPGFIDMGGGTEVRVGGRARGEFDTRR